MIQCSYTDALSSTVFMTIGQLALVVRNANRLTQDFSYYAEPIIIWGIAQPTVALVSLALPSVFHLVRRASKYGCASLFNLADPEMDQSQPRPLPESATANIERSASIRTLRAKASGDVENSAMSQHETERTGSESQWLELSEISRVSLAQETTSKQAEDSV